MYVMKQLAKEINRLCGEYRACLGEVERRAEAGEWKKELAELCEAGRKEVRSGEVGLLVALLDAYEVTRDEGMLQEVLDVVGEWMERLEASPEAVKLLAYCGHYVEEEECAERARSLLEELQRQGADVAELELELADLL